MRGVVAVVPLPLNGLEGSRCSRCALRTGRVGSSSLHNSARFMGAAVGPADRLEDMMSEPGSQLYRQDGFADYVARLEGSVGGGRAVQRVCRSDLDAEPAGVEMLAGAFENGPLAFALVVPAEH